MNQPAKVHRYAERRSRDHVGFGRCIHAAECVRRAPVAFDPRAKPWIRPEKEPVHGARGRGQPLPVGGACRCSTPTARRRWYATARTPAHVNANGPYYFRGRLVLKQGDDLLDETRLALCRCGASQRTSHFATTATEDGFAHDATRCPSPRRRRPGADFAAPLTITPDAERPPAVSPGRSRCAMLSGRPVRGGRLPLPLRRLAEQAVLRRHARQDRLQRIATCPHALFRHRLRSQPGRGQQRPRPGQQGSLDPLRLQGLGRAHRVQGEGQGR